MEKISTVSKKFQFEQLVFVEGRKKLTPSVESNPDHICKNHVLSLLCHPCSPLILQYSQLFPQPNL